MKKRMYQNAILLLSFGQLSACTVLGFATDIALIEATQEKHEPSQKSELIFTKEGIKHDAEVIAGVLEPLVKAVKDNKSKQPLVKQKPSRANYKCPHEVDSNGKCYTSEHYAKFYEKVSNLNADVVTDTRSQ